MPIFITYILALVLTSSPASAQTEPSLELSFGCDLALTSPVANLPKVRVVSLNKNTFDPLNNATVPPGADMIFVDAPNHLNVNYGRGAGYLFIPTEVQWMRFIQPFEQALSQMNEGDRNRLASQVEISRDLVRSEIGPLTTAEFRKWYKIYDQNRISQNLGPRRINSNWAKNLGSTLNKYQRLFFYEKETGELLGGLIFTYAYDLRVLHEAFKGKVQPLKLETRAFAEIMNYGAQDKSRFLYYPSDWNIFGHFSTMSSLELKTSLGLLPVGVPERRLVKVLNTDSLNRDFVIFAYRPKTFYWEPDSLSAHHFTDKPRNLAIPGGVDLEVHDLRQPADNSTTNVGH